MDRLTQLDAYVRLVDCGSFSEVSKQLRVGQSTVSKWIAALESEVGVALLDRTTRSQRVTDAGKRFYQRARNIVDEYGRALEESAGTERTMRGRIRMGLPTVFGRLFVLPLLSQLLHNHPELELDIVMADRYVSLVEEGFDLAVRVGVPIDSTLRTHSLGSTPRRVVASPEYVARHGVPSTPRDLERHSCLVHAEPGARTLWRFTRDGRRYQSRVRGRVAINHSEATLVLAKEGFGIALLAAWLADEDIEAGDLVALLLDYSPPPAPIRALTPPGRAVSPRVRRVLEHLREGLVAFHA